MSAWRTWTLAIATLWLIGLIVLIVVSSLEMSLADGIRSLWATWWGRTTLFDFYGGILIIAAWIWWRERSPLRSAVWTVALIGLGNLASLAYVALAAIGSRDVRSLLLGRRAHS